MRSLARALRLLGHVPVSLLCAVWWRVTRRGLPLLFTHAGDADESGRDVQMGPLADRLRREAPTGRGFVEVCLASLDGGYLRDMLRKRRGYISWGAVLALGRAGALCPGVSRAAARLWATNLLLGMLRPSVLFLIDEAGSGQSLVRAARRRGIRTVGVQHGDFQRKNPQYAGGEVPSGAGDRVAPDLLALWSPWFRDRLLAVSQIHGEGNTCVVGRLAHGEEAQAASRAPGAAPDGKTRVLMIADQGEAFALRAEPYLQRLRADARIALRIRPHPGESAARWPADALFSGSLGDALRWSEVVLGLHSSALLEALWFARPAVCLASAADADEPDYVQAGVAELSGSPEALVHRCLQARAAEGEGFSRTLAQREEVWGGAPTDPVGELLARARDDLNPER